MLEDGQYTIDVTLTGGSGKANVSSPANIIVENGEVKATIEWSSPNYDYMEVGSREYYPINEEGNSVFEIDVPTLDTDIPIKAETTAMSQPHLIEYTLYFDSSTAQNQQTGHTSVTVIAALICSVSVCVAALAKRKKDHAKN